MGDVGLTGKPSVSEERLWPFGAQVGDTKLTSYSKKTGELNSEYIRVPSGLLLFDEQICDYLHVSKRLTVVLVRILPRVAKDKEELRAINDISVIKYY